MSYKIKNWILRFFNIVRNLLCSCQTQPPCPNCRGQQHVLSSIHHPSIIDKFIGLVAEVVCLTRHLPWITLQIKNKVSSRSSGEDIWNSSELGQSFAGRSERLVCQSVLVIRAEHIMDYLLLVKAMGTMVTSIQSWYVLGSYCRLV